MAAIERKLLYESHYLTIFNLWKCIADFVHTEVATGMTSAAFSDALGGKGMGEGYGNGRI